MEEFQNNIKKFKDSRKPRNLQNYMIFAFKTKIKFRRN